MRVRVYRTWISRPLPCRIKATRGGRACVNYLKESAKSLKGMFSACCPDHVQCTWGQMIRQSRHGKSLLTARNIIRYHYFVGKLTERH